MLGLFVFTLTFCALMLGLYLARSFAVPRAVAPVVPGVFMAAGLVPIFMAPQPQAPATGLFTIDLSQYMTAAVGGVPIMFIVMGLVYFSKSMGLSGKGLQGAAMAIGLVLGSLYQISALGVPGTFADGFAIGLYGLGLGILSFMSYDMAGDLIAKAVAFAMGGGPDPGGPGPD